MARDDIDEAPPNDDWRDSLSPEPVSAVVHRVDVVQGDIPPHDLAAEGAVLNVALLTPEHLPSMLEFLAPEHFYSEAHTRIWGAFRALAEAQQPLDVVTVASWLRAHDRLESVGGMAYLIELMNQPAIANPVAYARIVHERWRTRSLIALAHDVAAHGYHSAEPIDAQLGRASTRVAEIMAVGTGGDRKTLGQEALCTPLPELPWLVPSMGIAPGAPLLVAGYGYSRKTMAMQSLALSVATGKPVWGVYACRKGPILHIDFEQGARLTIERYQRLARGMGIDVAQLPPDAFEAECLPAWRIDADGSEEKLLRACKGKAFVLIDSMRAAAPSADENSSEVRAPLDMLGRVSERTGAVIAVIHHARKPSKDATGGARMGVRGSGAIYDACSGVFVFSGEKGEATRVEHEKERNRGVCLDTFGIDAEDVELDGNPRWGLRVVHLEAEQVAPNENEAARKRFESACDRVLSAVALNPGASQRLVREMSGVRAGTVPEALAWLVKEKRIIDLGGKNGSSYRVV